VTARAARKGISLVLALLLLSPISPALAQAPPAATEQPGGIWPRQIEANGATVLVYQPQLDKWQANRLEARAAVSVAPAGGTHPFFGVIWITARTDVDKEQGVVTLEDIRISKVNFPEAPGRNPEFLRIARQHLPGGVRTIPLAQLEANLAITQATVTPKGLPVNNTPPRIIVSPTPGLLVRIDGTPSLRQPAGAPLMRVINTRALILLDPRTGWYYLHVRGRWAQASTIQGPWTAAVNPPAALEDAKRAAVATGTVDLLDGGAQSGPLPTIYVSTEPAELIETTGPPTWSPIEGTELLSVTNTQAHIFLELRSQYTYVLISGRWFRARSLDGPWEYVPGGQLPRDFAKIPEHSPQGVVLASIPGTWQAQEAVIANTIPQTATVNRTQAHFTATYDGPPRWVPITGTPLVYAFNSPTPIIRVGAATYYSLYNAVWFVATAPVGPWVVAASIPTVIYTIPLTSPLHYVTYVRVYGATPAAVYVGYTPGYLGTVVAPDGVVVYGTGIVYAPWVGTVWYPPPPTYGFGAGFAWGMTTGFMMGAVAGGAVWGCCGSTTNVNVNVNKTTINGSNVYNNWSKTTVSSGSKSATVYRGPNSAMEKNNQNNNVYASHDGNVYRKENGQWQKWNGQGQGWQPVQRPTKSTPGSSSSPTGSSSSTRPTPEQGGNRQQPSTKGAGSSARQGAAQDRSAGGGQGLGQRGSEGSGQGFGQRAEGGGQRLGSGEGGFGQRFGGGEGQGGGWFQNFRQRFGGGEGRSGGGGLFQGLDRDSFARDLGSERWGGFGGSGGGGGLFGGRFRGR
jgi:hypothetical protein